MAYTNVWSKAAPLGSQAANLLDDDIRALKLDISERFTTLFGTADLDALDPIIAPFLKLQGSATSKIIPGVTSLSLRNNADNADNVLISDAGQVTVRNNLIVNSILYVQDQLIFQSANLNKIVNGSVANGMAFRNNADNASNIIITDGGAVTIRNGFTLTAGDANIAAGNLFFGNTNARIIPGSNTLVIRDNANSQDNVTIGNSGTMTVLSTLTSKATINVDRVGLALDPNFVARGDAGRNKGLIFQTGILNRWYITCDSGAESGGNAGSSFLITSYDDAGASLGNAITINRSSRVVTIVTGVSVGGAGVSISAGGLSITSGDLVFNQANPRIRPGTVDLSIRNNANNKNNILITDNGQTTIVGDSGVPPLIIGRSDAVAALITHLLFQRLGSTKSRIGLDASDQFCIQDAAGANANLTITDAGNATLRGSLTIGAGTLNLSITSGTILNLNSTTNTTSDVNQVVFQRGGTNKWRIGSNINGTNTDEFNIYNDSGALTAVRIANTTGAVHLPTSLQVNGGAVITKILSATVTWDPPSTVSGAFASTTVTVTGAAVGDPVFFANVWMADSAEALTMSAYVSSADTVTIQHKNTSAGTVDFTSRTTRVFVFHV